MVFSTKNTKKFLGIGHSPLPLVGRGKEGRGGRGREGEGRDGSGGERREGRRRKVRGGRGGGPFGDVATKLSALNPPLTHTVG